MNGLYRLVCKPCTVLRDMLPVILIPLGCKIAITLKKRTTKHEF